MVWGYQPERVQAGIYLLFYTLLASLPLLVGILFVYNSLGSLCLFILCGNGSLVSGLFSVSARQGPSTGNQNKVIQHSLMIVPSGPKHVRIFSVTV